ncbi:hypothetical protein B0H13DRAFT_1657506 [Mycena leptocephala]|nr:hypothetical protein B0H13DRAFT_1657506 [Mycena leptocephala]
MANLGTSNSSTTIDPNTINFANLVAGVDFDAMIASEKPSESSDSTPHSVFAEIDTAGHLAHKKTILRTFFDMTQDSHSSHDRLQRVRGYTIGGKSWNRNTGEDVQNVSPATHFQLGNLFTTLIGYNGTHVGLAVAKCTLIKHCTPGSKAASVAAIPRAELHLPKSPYTISGQIFSLVPLGDVGNCMAWDGNFVSFTVRKKKSNGEDVSHLRNLQFAVSSRLVDCTIHEMARETLLSDTDRSSEREKTWSFLQADLQISWNNLWSRLLNDSSLHEKFPTFASVSEGVFPYQLSGKYPD